MRNPIFHFRGVTRISVVAVAGLFGLSLVTGSVSALLQAQSSNATAHGISSGTLKLIQADNGAGFTSTISDMAPGDVVNRYVDYTNAGTLASKTLRLKVVDATSTMLTSNATRGLQLVVSDCSTSWNNSTGACTGGTVTQLLSSPVSALGIDTNFSGITTLGASTGMLHLQFKLTLPDAANNEITTNGLLPANTIQGLTANLTWTLSETQRDATETNA